MIPTLSSKRITLRPYRLSDAESVKRLAGEKIISDMTANIPHPYLDGMAEQWIAKHALWFQQKEALVLAIQLSGSGEHIGTISLTQIKAGTANLGYWIGTPFWGNGYCSEAASLLIQYGFSNFKLQSIYARHLSNNPASGRVMLKNGFIYCHQVVEAGEPLLHYELSKSQWQIHTQGS